MQATPGVTWYHERKFSTYLPLNILPFFIQGFSQDSPYFLPVFIVSSGQGFKFLPIPIVLVIPLVHQTFMSFATSVSGLVRKVFRRNVLPAQPFLARINESFIIGRVPRSCGPTITGSRAGSGHWCWRDCHRRGRIWRLTVSRCELIVTCWGLGHLMSGMQGKRKNDDIKKSLLGEARTRVKEAWRKLGGSLKEAWKKLEEDGDGKRSTRPVESGFVLYIRTRRRCRKERKRAERKESGKLRREEIKGTNRERRPVSFWLVTAEDSMTTMPSCSSTYQRGEACILISCCSC